MPEKFVLDPASLAILTELQRDARVTMQELAARVGLSSTPCWKRVKAMEAAGVIRGYGVEVDAAQVGLALRVMVEVNLSTHHEEDVQRFERAVAASPHIVQCYSTTGQADYVLVVLAADIKAYERLLHDTLFRLPGVVHVRSSVVLREVKPGGPLPIAAGPAHAGSG